jgi:23S rRNA (uracil1939-C5)-methyltransferase
VLQSRVQTRPGCAQAVAVTALDTGASGLCLFVKRPERAETWARVITAEGARREFIALARGVVRDKGMVARPLDDAREARTRYKRLRVVGGHSLVRVSIEPGVPGQLRRHLAAIDHPVLGDSRAGHAASNRHALDRSFVHAARIACVHPATGAALSWEAPLPGDLATVLARLEARDATPEE